MKFSSKHIWAGAVAVVSFQLFATSVFASIPPSFPSCQSPSGTIKVTYPSGVHGIVNDTSEHRGSDTVYDVSDVATLQCFCAEDGAGIQTNWWKASSITQEEIAILVQEGWIYVENGALWGLAETRYLAKNANYTCASSSGGGSSSSSSNSSSSSSSNSSSSSSSSNNLGDVLGLAYTGTIVLVILTGLISSLFLFLGYTMSKRK